MFSIVIEWRPGIGDPTVPGWINTVGYLIAAVLCGFAAWRRQKTKEGKIWGVLGLFLLLMGVNKQLDLQELLRDAGRAVAEAQGWMDARRGVQRAFAAGAIAAMITLLVLVRGTARSFLKDYPQVWVGLGLLCLFVAIRVIGFEHVDEWLGWSLDRFEGIWLCELAGIVGVGWGAIRGALRAPSRGIA